MRHDPSVPQFYSQREMIGLERKAAGLGRSGDSKKSLPQAQKRKHQKIKERSVLLSTTLTNQDALAPNQPPVKRRRLSADKALVISEVGSENIDIDSISLGRRKR